MSKKTLELIKDLLDKEGVAFKHLPHETIPPNSQGAAGVRGTKLSDGVKALVLKTKDGVFFQVLVPAHRRANLKAIKQYVGVKNVSLASPDEVLALTDCIVGSVPPLGVLWNLRVLADSYINNNNLAVFSAGTLEDSMSCYPKDLLKVNDAEVGDFAKK